MGSKVNPVGMRTGIIKTWDSSWYAGKRTYAKVLKEDIAIRKFIMVKLNDTGIAKLELERNAKDITINIHSSKPGVIIGRQGAGVEGLKAELEKKFGHKFTLNVKEVKKPELVASLVAENIAMQIERRVSYRRAAKMAVQKAMDAGAKGIKIRVGGRLNGVEIARSEFYSEGQIPLHTFRADIDYAGHPARTTYGIIGVKVWVNRGMVYNKQNAST
ncbi:30S ribosomal protein S3 [Candidatus Peregrinibacteria bacterium]|jgi:small subunit ribosomal protein S3|nr:30S ribosomal protein S3 [Candidatus Peregrinibacteria bacterium]MBT4631627.1 30S ribosomal protein S3 [Candidatus Peregrinibacteria bacterium]MBT5516755.1 30S ribosomal protein S3 [Candidatus Peregrinibacteria bacterium]MBT5823963.1 30S ribosomal protein S3 [Candidatus Peregrinibacteria bacterium]